MPLPPSFQTEGFVSGATIRPRMLLRSGKKLKPLMLGTEGETNTGKSEFLLSAPGPGIIIPMDRGFDGMLDNPNPPKERRQGDFAWLPMQVPLNTTATQAEYGKYFAMFRDGFYKALANKDALTVCIDGDSDSWELQRLAEFGKLANVWPQTKYGDAYAHRRAMIAKAWDSGKIIIATNKIRDEYVKALDDKGMPIKEADGTDKKEKSGRKERQGFPDQDYLWQVQIRHMYKPAHKRKMGERMIDVPQNWGLVILKCKPNPGLIGSELWGADCNFKGLVQHILPEVPLTDWGF